MKVILTQNVPKLGVVGDICDVAPGYGRNYLIPQGMAILATAGARRQIEDLKRTEQRRQARLRSEAEQIAARVDGVRLEFRARVGETGRLYGSITATDIAEALEARLGVDVDRRKIHLEEPLRTLGEHEVIVHFMPQVEARVTVNIEPEEVASATHATSGEVKEKDVSSVGEASAGAGDEEPPQQAAADRPAEDESGGQVQG